MRLKGFTIIPWIVISIFSLIIGASTLHYLVTPPLEMSIFLTITIILSSLVVYISARSFKRWNILLGIFAITAFILVGFLASNSVYLSQEEHRELPAITRSLSDKGDGHTAVIYFTHGEPPAYSAMPWIETFHELDADGVSFIPAPFRAFFLNNLRSEYLMIGGSYHNKEHQQMIKSLEDSMPEQKAKGTRFYLAFLDSDPRPDAMAIQALNEGASKMVIAPVFLTISSHTKAGQEMIEALELERYGVDVSMAEPLWNSPSLKQMFVTRSNLHLGGTDKTKVGILLVGHGQPDDWDKIYASQTEQENLFREDVRQLLIQDGYEPEMIKLAWMEFKEPKIGGAVKELLSNGASKIFVFPASISASSIHSDIQIPLEAQKAGVPKSIEVINMGAWGNDPLVIQAIREKILTCNP